MNERKTENLVREILREQGYLGSDNIFVEEQASDNPKIDKLLRSASKSGTGIGRPEFIITFPNQPENIIIVECKASVKFHESKGRKQYKDYAVDGALLYASHLKDAYNVVGIAVSGETEREMRVSHFLWLKGKRAYLDIGDKSLIDPKSLFKVIDRHSEPIKEEELIKKAIEYNESLHSYSIPEVERCTVISSILVALQDNVFVDSYRSHYSDEEEEDENPNAYIIDDLLSACNRVLKKNQITSDKKDIILREYEKIKSNHTFRSKYLVENKVRVKNRVLRDLIYDVNTHIMPYINDNVYDVLGKFYTQFIRYAGSDSKTGLVLTPPHITDFFCDLADITEDDIVFDPCCGTGGFLVSAMKSMVEKAGSDLVKHKKIKTEQLIGIEKRADMFSHACSNMMMRGDGKSHIHFGDSFDETLINKVKAEKPNKAFLNPPYDVGETGQLEFVETALDTLVKDGLCISICQMSAAISSKTSAVEVKKRLLAHHTLVAVLSMPDDLFYPVGVITSIIIFRAHTPHSERKETFFGYFKDDGFVKVKAKGRLDVKKKWAGVKEAWLDAYENGRNKAGLSVTKSVTANDEWCAEAYMETDYSKITKADFEDVVKKYALFNLMNGSSGA